MSKPIPAGRIAYRPTEAAAVLGLSRSRLYELLADGTIPYRQVGSVRLIARSTLEAFVADVGAP